MLVREYLLKMVEEYTSHLWEVSSDINWIRQELDKYLDSICVER